jgi:hypothetical protein
LFFDLQQLAATTTERQDDLHVNITRLLIKASHYQMEFDLYETALPGGHAEADQGDDRAQPSPAAA